MKKWESIYHNAISFESVANLLLENKNKEMFDQNKQTYIFHVIPYIVNLSFSVELYIKSLLEYENKLIKGHRTEKLFAELTNDIQEKLKEIEPQIKDLLKKTSSYFEKWRYSYEKNDLTFIGDDLQKILKALKQYLQTTYFK